MLPSRLGQLDLSVVHANWPVLLATAFEDLASVGGGQFVLMIWDEFPLMLYNIARSDGERVAIQLLDHLRSLRQQHCGKLRFLFTGSVGLHLVIRSLHRAGNANDPTNDLFPIAVQPLKKEHTVALATALLHEVDVRPDDLGVIARDIAEQVEGFPYYVHHVVDQLHLMGRRIQVSDVTSVVDRLVDDPQDAANFRYYRKRIDTYYDETERPIAIAILNGLATSATPLGIEQLQNLITHRVSNANTETVRSVLALLIEDHYLSRERSNSEVLYSFRWRLVKRWWREAWV